MISYKTQRIIFINVICLLYSFSVAGRQSIVDETTTAKQSSLYLIENNGQLADQYMQPRNDIHYKLKGGKGLNVFIGNGVIYYQWLKTMTEADSEGVNKPAGMEVYQLQLELAGANTGAERIEEKPRNHYENYYLPQCPSGVTAYAYDKITYKNIYPNIDWVIYTNGESGEGLKYDLLFARVAGRKT